MTRFRKLKPEVELLLLRVCWRVEPYRLEFIYDHVSLALLCFFLSGPETEPANGVGQSRGCIALSRGLNRNGLAGVGAVRVGGEYWDSQPKTR